MQLNEARKIIAEGSFPSGPLKLKAKDVAQGEGKVNEVAGKLAIFNAGGFDPEKMEVPYLVLFLKTPEDRPVTRKDRPQWLGAPFDWENRHVSPQGAEWVSIRAGLGGWTNVHVTSPVRGVRKVKFEEVADHGHLTRELIRAMRAAGYKEVDSYLQYGQKLSKRTVGWLRKNASRAKGDWFDLLQKKMGFDKGTDLANLLDDIGWSPESMREGGGRRLMQLDKAGRKILWAFPEWAGKMGPAPSFPSRSTGMVKRLIGGRPEFD